MQTIIIGKDFSEIQKLNTEAEISRLIQSGYTLITLGEMQQKLNEIGLKLDMNENSYLYLYYNTYNETHYLNATTSPIDDKKISAYNVNGDFYNKYLKGSHTDKGLILDKLRSNYFCTYTKKNKTYILSF
jgi:hypothetical protein